MMSGDNSENDQENFSPEQVERYWGWALHEDNLFWNRINFFMVAQSMLFAGFAALLGSNAESRNVVLNIINFGGAIFAILWFYTCMLQINLTMNPIKKVLREHLREYRTLARGRHKYPGANVMAGEIFPIVLLGVWVFLFFSS